MNPLRDHFLGRKVLEDESLPPELAKVYGVENWDDLPDDVWEATGLESCRRCFTWHDGSEMVFHAGKDGYDYYCLHCFNGFKDGIPKWRLSYYDLPR